MKIGILVVTYNAEAKLRRVLERIPDDIMQKVEEIFIFDDASHDSTHEVGQQLEREFAGKVKFFRNERNLMYGGNQQRGYKYAVERGLDFVVLLHGDGQYAPEIMQDLLTPLENGEADMVMGSRMMVKGAALRGRMPMYKYIGNKILTGIENALVGSRFSEFHSGYRAYSVHALKHVPLGHMTSNWHFDTQIILEFLKRDGRVLEVPIPTYYGDEICHVNGIPYAMNCIAETSRYFLKHRWRKTSHGSLPTSPRPKK